MRSDRQDPDLNTMQENSSVTFRAKNLPGQGAVLVPGPGKLATGAARPRRGTTEKDLN
jgi:hypothetical protein